MDVWIDPVKRLSKNIQEGKIRIQEILNYFYLEKNNIVIEHR